MVEMFGAARNITAADTDRYKNLNLSEFCRIFK